MRQQSQPGQNRTQSATEIGQNRTESDKIGQNRTESDRIGAPEKTDRIGQCRLQSDRTDNVRQYRRLQKVPKVEHRHQQANPSARRQLPDCIGIPKSDFETLRLDEGRSLGQNTSTRLEIPRAAKENRCKKLSERISVSVHLCRFTLLRNYPNNYPTTTWPKNCILL